jgi:hypothetical protein
MTVYIAIYDEIMQHEATVSRDKIATYDKIMMNDVGFFSLGALFKHGHVVLRNVITILFSSFSPFEKKKTCFLESKRPWQSTRSGSSNPHARTSEYVSLV